MSIKTVCPSGLRGWTQVPLAQAAWVQIPQLSVVGWAVRWPLPCGPGARHKQRHREPLRAEPNGFLVHHLNHSVTVSWLHDGRTCTRVGGWWEADRRWPRDFGLHGLRGWCFEHPAPRGPAAVRSFDALGMLPATGLRSTKSSASRDAVGAIRVLEVFSSSRSVFHLMPRGTSNRRARKHLVAGSPCSAPVKGHSISGHAWFIWTPRRPAT